MRDFDRVDVAAIGTFSDAELEIARLRMLHQLDDRYEVVLCHLAVRGLHVIARVCREGAETFGLCANRRNAAVEDATVRLLLRANRLEQLPPIAAVAAQIAAECLRAQDSRPVEQSYVVAERPPLRVIDGSAEQRFARNDWRIS